MVHEKSVCLYLEAPLLISARAGRHNFINQMVQVLEAAGFHIRFSDVAARSGGHRYTLTHMARPTGVFGLVFRRAYHYPFWHIDQVAARWDWTTANATFDADLVPRQAGRFYRYWQNRLFGVAAQNATRDGLIYVPLQARLTDHRSFQTTSPLQMVKHCIENSGGRDVVVGLHPKVNYSPSEMHLLERLVAQHPNTHLVTGEAQRYLQCCDLVVTENSSVAFDGYLFGKPTLLFAQIDFHHIAIKARMNDLAGSFERAAQHQPRYAEYMWWFWQQQCINAGRPDARDRIADRLRYFGWPLP